MIFIDVKWESSAVMHRVVCQYTDVSQVLTVSIFSVEHSKTTYEKSVWVYFLSSQDGTHKHKIYRPEKGKVEEIRLLTGKVETG